MTEVLFPLHGTSIVPMIGRRKAMDRLWRELSKPMPSHLQVVGPRFAGKTVLLHALAERMRGADSPFQVVLYWDLGHQTPSSNEAFLEQLSGRIAKELDRADSPYADELLGLEPEDLYSTLQEVLEVLGDDGVQLLILMDGFDKPLAGDKLSRNLWDQLRELGSLSNLRYVTGSRQPLSRLIRSEESATSDFWNIFDQVPVRLGGFDDDDVAEVVGRLPFELDSGARTELRNWTGHFPPLLFGLLNELTGRRASGSQGTSVRAGDVNDAAEEGLRSLDGHLSALWRDCPAPVQDRYRDLVVQGEMARLALGIDARDMLGALGFVEGSGNRVRAGCRLLKTHLERHNSGGGGIARLFGTWEAYASNVREVLERRLSHLGRIDERLRRPVEHAISDIPDHPDDCLNNLTNIQERALEVIWRQEFGDDRILPQELWDQWNWMDGDNRTVGALRECVERKIPPDRFLQCRMLELLTGSRARFESRARFATKDMYVLVDAIHGFRNRSQHGDGESMRLGVAVAALMLCVELLGCIDHQLSVETDDG